MTAVTNPFNDFVFLNATPSDRGSFTLALDKALDKLEKFQLPDPSFFLLQWIQALVASGSGHIAITLEGSRFSGQFDLRIVFDGPGYTAKELQGLYDHVFLSGRDRGQDRLRELALGWLSASSLKPSYLAITSNGWARVRDKAAQGGGGKTAEVTSQIPASEGPIHMLVVTGRASCDFANMLSTLCSDVPVLMTLNGTQISHPTVPTGVPWPNRPFENGATRGVMGATYGTDSSSQIAFLRYGVNFVSRTEPSLQPPVIVRVSDPTLSKNVSQTDVVRDDAYDEFLARLRSEMKAMGLSLTGKRIPSYQREALNRYLQSYIVNHLDIRALEDPQRLELLGEDYRSLLEYPVFSANKGLYRSLADLHSIYRKQGSLVYCVDPQARAVSWAGVLLVLSPEEVGVLRKFFPNLIGLSLETVKAQSRMGRATVGPDLTGNAPALARQGFFCSSRKYTVSVPDCYPTGVAVLQPKGSSFGTALPGLKLTLSVEFEDAKPPNHTEIVQLEAALRGYLPQLMEQLVQHIASPRSETTFSRPRAAELLCELINDEFGRLSKAEEKQQLINRMRNVPLLGLEDGRLVSLFDLVTFMKLVPQVYVGGVFIDGLDSGALDPMPEARRLLHRIYPAQRLISTAKIRDRLLGDADLRFQLRRQAVMRGLASSSDPKRVLEQFASEAAQEAAELARIEQEYRQALDGPTLFVRPDEERLAELAADDGDGDLPLLDLSTLAPGAAPSEATKGELPAVDSTPTTQPLPSLESDVELCRHLDPDLFPDRDSLHVERRDAQFSLHMATCPPGQGKLYLLCGADVQARAVAQPVRGFVRVSPGSIGFDVLLREGLEQLTVRAVHTFTEGPPTARARRALRTWLLHLSCGDIERLAASEHRRNDLFDLAVVPSLGGKSLSWRSLKEQALRVGETVVWSGAAHVTPCPQREVMLLQTPVTSELLRALGYPAQREHREEKAENPFDDLYRSTRRDLASVLSGQSTPLLQTNLVEQLAGDASMWKRWRSGFLTWDREQSVVVMNPGHKVGKKLAQRFSTDPSWSRIFASALFSTINRGLEEVEDRHERVFLESLLDSLD